MKQPSESWREYNKNNWWEDDGFIIPDIIAKAVKEITEEANKIILDKIYKEAVEKFKKGERN